MAPNLEVLKGGGGSIRVGTTGTIGSLMSKELDRKCTTQTPISPKQQQSSMTVSAPCGVVNGPKRLQPRTTLNEASSSSSSNNNRSNKNINYGQPDTTQKARRKKSTHQMPILTSDNAPDDMTPSREKTDKKVLNLVEIVDIKCGNPNKWSTPIANRFKKLNSSKLSETIA